MNLAYTMRDGFRRNSDEWEELSNIQHSIFTIALELTRTRPRVSTELDLLTATRLTEGRLCTDIRDRIFAIVSLLRNGNRFVIDYNQSLDELFVNVLRFYIADSGEHLVITGFLPILFESIAHRLELRPLVSLALPPVQTLLDDIEDFDNAEGEFFWAQAPIRTQIEFPSADGHDCSLCIGIEICGHQGILKFWCRSDMSDC